MQIGMTLSSEEHEPRRLVALAGLAEEHGFEFVSISDHYHPWVDEQGHSAFVWAVLGGIAERTTALGVAVGVTCPIMRIHPAVIAQAAATTACLMPGRFTLGLGTGEALNEHITGERWPPADVRLEMLEEAIQVIRELWGGGVVTHRGRHYTVEDARVYDVPETLPEIVVSAFGPLAAKLAARTADGLWTSPKQSEAIAAFDEAGGSGPRYAQLTLSWAEDEDAAVENAHRIWPNAGVPGQLSQDLPTPAHFQQASSIVTPAMIKETIPCGPDPQPVLEAIRSAVDAGIDHVYLHQIGPDQDGFLKFWDNELRDAVASMRS